ncbi:phosphoribosyltransferase [Streptococcus salivarius]|uniref:phosphoribosyltransferase n=1 Tax=Streptococcus salivarius TaxID=1304 RepID=UPI001BD9D2F9|nr:hypothetical protein [Streptococcus salivarius]MBT0913580.1 hypothetical protein [Streptococcus salivarius]
MTIDLREEVRLADEALALDWYKDNGYTNIGEAVCAIKYGYIQNNSLAYTQLQHEINYLVEQLKIYVENCDIILPVPSFNPYHKDNPDGNLKIMYMIAERLSEVSGKKVDFSVLEKRTPEQAKDSQISADSYVSKNLPSNIKNVLLIDDLFGEGNTARFTVEALKKSNPNIFVRFVSLTKNKYGGIHKLQECRISKINPYHVNDSGNESIKLYFYKDKGKKSETVRIWSDNNQFALVKEALEAKDFSKVFVFSVYRNQKGFWQIAKD